MSKRKKNYPDPLEIVNKYGADALRWVCRQQLKVAAIQKQIIIMIITIKIGFYWLFTKHTRNKIWLLFSKLVYSNFIVFLNNPKLHGFHFLAC